MQNYFELFALPVGFNVDMQRLSSNYQELQKLTHPDKFAGQSELEQRLAMQKNSQINDGYQVLKSPVRRAEHMLQLRGIEIANETQTMQDMEFLMQQMQWRERLEEVDNHQNPQDELDDLLEQVEQQQSQLKTNIANQLGENTQSAALNAADEVRKLKFTDKMYIEITEKEEQLLG